MGGNFQAFGGIDQFHALQVDAVGIQIERGDVQVVIRIESSVYVDAPVAV